MPSKKKKNPVEYQHYKGEYPYWVFSMHGRMLGSAKTLKTAKKRGRAYTLKTGKTVLIVRYFGRMSHD